MIAAKQAEFEGSVAESEDMAVVIPFPEVAYVGPPVDPASIPRDHAWQQGLESHLPSLRRYAGSLSRGNAQDVDDLVQDCVVRALTAGDTHPPQKGKARQWLFSILHNSFVNGVRRAKTKQTASKTLIDTLPTCTQPTQHVGLEMGELAVAVNRLPKTQRAVLLMICVEEMSYKEVAAALNIPIGTVMSTLARARQTLRTLDLK